MGDIVKFNIGQAQIELPTDVVMRNFLDSLQQPPLELLTLHSTRTLIVGAEYPDLGGVYAGVMRGDNHSHYYHLIVPTHPDAYNESVEWGGAAQDEPGAKSTFDGLTNTVALCESKHAHPAAEWAQSVSIDGFNDFYLPSLRELRLCWVNTPELFKDGWYWTSTQYSADGAYVQHFAYGGQSDAYKDTQYRARLVRRFVSPLTI